jgi:hypothetical protein
MQKMALYVYGVVGFLHPAGKKKNQKKKKEVSTKK